MRRWNKPHPQYVMSGSTPGISRKKGGVQVREMMESSGIGVANREPTAGRRPIVMKTCHIITAIASVYLVAYLQSLDTVMVCIAITAIPH